ncbi:hypothetical protein K432DRAFT_385161 [Lepidopterella palustris CBS 459.81]|uniref:ABM domain-containing protein n=1 Tax=Lepidopterella palustris CBS 459.81 TaxID=1314670 RepID=A0A8E2JBU9_9PEZI|nr:hypothetical protein K432DRAFT_385161 [Lepidopterella palustris CBS 459.81]
MSEQVNVVAILTPAEGKTEKIIDMLKDMVTKVQNESGVLQYDIFHEEKTGEIIFIEKYVDKATLDTHMSTPHFVEFGKAAGAEGFFAKKPELKFLTLVTGITKSASNL